MKEPVYIKIIRSDGTVEEGVAVGEWKMEGLIAQFNIEETITLQNGDCVEISGMTMTTSYE